MNKGLLNNLKNNYLDYLENVITNRSLCIQIKFNFLKNYINEVFETIEKILCEKRLFKSLLSINRVNNLFINNNNNNNNNNNLYYMNIDNNNIINNNFNNINNNDINNMINNNDDMLFNNNMNNIFNNNNDNDIDIDNDNDNDNDNINNNNANDISINNNMNNMNNINNLININNSNINMNNNNNVVINNSRKKFYILKINEENTLKKILTYLDNLVVPHYCICTEQKEYSLSTFWLLIQFKDKYKLNNELVYNTMINIKGYHSSDFYHFVLSKGKKVNLKKYKFH